MFNNICYEDRVRVVREMLNHRVKPGTEEEYKAFCRQCMDVLDGIAEDIPKDMEGYVKYPRKNRQ